MFLQEILESLNNGLSPAVGQLVIKNTTKDTLEAAPDALRHKFAVKVSSLLKSKSAERAFGTYLAARALQSPEIVKSHAVSWCPILLHLLDLPNPECWKGAVKALCILFQNAELRELGGASKIVDFVKRLITLVPKLPDTSLAAITHLCSIYPNNLRNYIPQLLTAIDSVLYSKGWRQALRARAALTFADKTPTAAWREQVICILTDISAAAAGKPLKWLPKPATNGLAIERLWYALQAYMHIHPAGAKVPTKRLIDAMEISLRTPSTVSAAIDFMLATEKEVGTVWALQFDSVFHEVAEAGNYGTDNLIQSIKCTAMLLRVAKTVPKKYMKALYSLYNKAYLLAYPKSDSQTTTQSIAGVLDHKFQNDDQKRVATVLSEISALIVISVQDIPASFRSKLDANMLSIGGQCLRTATLYPGKFSLLPVSLNKGLDGFETLVHPRFPPLSSAARSSNQNSEETDEIQLAESQASTQVPIMQSVKEEKVEAVPVPLPEVVLKPVPQPAPVETTVAVAPETATAPKPTGLVSESAKRSEAVASESSARPEKRQRVEENEQEDAQMEAGEDDDDDDFVIPTLEMDSD